MTKSGTIHFENLVQKALWDHELSGQISDGMWENARPHDHWQVWCRAETVVDGTLGTDIRYAAKRNYNFTNPELLDVIEDRMLVAAKMAMNGFIDDKSLHVNEMDERGYVELMAETGSADDYWVKKKAQVLAVFPTRESLIACQTFDAYTKKELRKDLNKIKLAIKTII